MHGGPTVSNSYSYSLHSSDWGLCVHRSWPGVTKLKDWHEFPQWSPQSLAAKFPNLEPAGVDLMQQMFIYDPAKRITVRWVSVAPL